MGEALAGYLQNIGIRTKIRFMERAAMTTASREKKLRNVIVGITGAGGNAATRLEAYVSRNGVYTSGVIPEVEDLFQRQARGDGSEEARGADSLDPRHPPRPRDPDPEGCHLGNGLIPPRPVDHLRDLTHVRDHQVFGR